jgi:resuscitation-promoting factor RpfA
VLCPRCRRESKEGTLYCPGCGAPLSLRAEPELPALDASLTLDRRAPTALRQGDAIDEERVDDLPPLPPPLPPLSHHRQPAPAPAPAPSTAARPAPRPTAAPPPAVPRSYEPVAPPVVERSHWDLRTSGVPGAPAAPTRASIPPPPPARPLPSGRSAPSVRPGPPPVVVPAVVPAGAPAQPPAAVRPPAPRPPPAPLLELEPLPAPRATPRPAPAAPLPEEGTVEVEIGPVEVHLRRAPTWKRAVAWFSDGAPFAALFAVALRSALDQLPHPVALDLYGYLDLAVQEARGISGPILAGVLILFGVYHALSHALAGATLGKRVLGLQVVGPTGARPGLARSAIRAVLALVSLLALGLGVLLALFTRSGRAFHDLLARTWVVEAP